MPKKSKKPSKEVSYEQLGKMLESIYESGYIDRNKTYKMSFLKGIAAGFGGVVGATVIVAILLWLLSLLNFVPFVDKIQCSLEKNNQTTSQVTQCQNPDNSAE
jgi:hypothetical protein